MDQQINTKIDKYIETMKENNLQTCQKYNCIWLMTNCAFINEKNIILYYFGKLKLSKNTHIYYLWRTKIDMFGMHINNPKWWIETLI